MSDLPNEEFLTNNKVISVVNLLSKFRIKLWELNDLSLDDSQKEVEVKSNLNENVDFSTYLTNAHSSLNF